MLETQQNIITIIVVYLLIDFLQAIFFLYRLLILAPLKLKS